MLAVIVYKWIWAKVFISNIQTFKFKSSQKLLRSLFYCVRQFDPRKRSWSQACKPLTFKRCNQTRGWVQLSVFRWIAIILFSITSVCLNFACTEMTLVTALRCSNLPLDSSFQRIKFRSFHCLQMLSVEVRISLYWTSLKRRRHFLRLWISFKIPFV